MSQLGNTANANADAARMGAAPAVVVRPRRRRRFGADAALGVLARGSAACVLVMLAALVSVLVWSSMPSFKAFGLSFVTSTEWRPNELELPKKGPDGKVLIEDGEVVTETIPPAFGALPVIYGTAVSSVIALAVAVPISLGAAIFLIRVAPALRIAAPVSFLVEFLAAIPSIAYGVWGLFVLSPFLRDTVEKPWQGTGRDMLCGGLVLAIMILPIITAVSRDVLRSVPRIQIEGTLALGATWWQSSWAMLRYSRSGLFGAVMLGLARAAGETMAVTMVIGNANRISASLLQPAQTMSSLLANEFAEATGDLHRSALLEVALILLLMSLTFNVVARYFIVGGASRTAAAH